MRFEWLQKLASVTICAGILSLSGCYSMNGYMTNASGLGYYEQGNYAMAAQEFQNAVASRPNNPDYLANLAKARMKMGDSAGAEQLFQQALTQSPSHQPSYHGYSELLLAQGRGQDAHRMLNTWAATQPYIAESHVELAWLQRELGQPDAAAQSLQQALQVNPNHATALAHLGQYHQDTGNPTEAVAMYQRALQANWNQPEVHSKLAVAAQAAGPNHPMGETAMARGVHPGSVPRQQMAFGPQMAPMHMASAPMQQMPQQQLAYQNPPSMPPQFAGQPQYSGQPQVAYQQDPGTAAYGQPPMMSQSVQMPTMPSPSSPVSQPFSPMMPFGIGGTVTEPMGSGESIPYNGGTMPTTQTSTPIATPAPMPDPAFSDSGKSAGPITSVSATQVSEAEVPEIEAF